MSRNLMAGWLLVCLGITAMVSGWALARDAQAASPVATVNEDLIRIHVIANSDSAEDQALKLKVRDAVLAELGPRLEGAASRAEVEAVIARSLRMLEATAGLVIDQQSFAYRVRAELGTFSFPGKSYGDLYLPAGDYKALRIVIGEGQGANFWCLVYPSLCYKLLEVSSSQSGGCSSGGSSSNDSTW